MVQSFASTVGQIGDTVIISKGQHTIKAGFEYMRDRINVFYAGNEGLAGQFTFNGQYTGNTLNGTTTNGLPKPTFCWAFRNNSAWAQAAAHGANVPAFRRHSCKMTGK